MKRYSWNKQDRQSFADGERLRAHRIGDKRKISSKQACRKFNQTEREQ